MLHTWRSGLVASESMLHDQRFYTGYLTKDPMHGHLFSSARRRFFVLTEMQLEWFPDESVTAESLGKICLVGATVERRNSASKQEAVTPRGNELVISSGNDQLVLRGEQLDAWEAAIKRQVTLANGHPSPPQRAPAWSTASLLCQEPQSPVAAMPPTLGTAISAVDETALAEEGEEQTASPSGQAESGAAEASRGDLGARGVG